MTWLDVITPIPETLIKDDERRKAVNRGILLVAIALVVVVFFWNFFDDMSTLTDAPSFPGYVVLLGIARIALYFLGYLAVCWCIKVLIFFIPLFVDFISRIIRKKKGISVQDEQKNDQCHGQSESPLEEPIRLVELHDILKDAPLNVRANLFSWISIPSNRKGPKLAYLYLALTENHLLIDATPGKFLEALVNTYPNLKFVEETTIRHACGKITNRPQGHARNEDRKRIDTIYKDLTRKELPK